MVYVQQSEESRRRHDSGRANRSSHRYVVYFSNEGFNYVVSTIFNVVFSIIIPAAILVVNVVVAIQVRRSAISAAANLGVQPHHQSSSSVTPTIMLITTSLVYLLSHTVRGISFAISLSVPRSNISVYKVAFRCFLVSDAVWQLIFTYNFYVYLITSKQFRSDLYKLLCRCLSSSSAPASGPAIIVIAAVNNAEVARRDIAEADTAV